MWYKVYFGGLYNLLLCLSEKISMVQSKNTGRASHSNHGTKQKYRPCQAFQPDMTGMAFYASKVILELELDLLTLKIPLPAVVPDAVAS